MLRSLTVRQLQAQPQQLQSLLVAQGTYFDVSTRITPVSAQRRDDDPAPAQAGQPRAGGLRRRIVEHHEPRPWQRLEQRVHPLTNQPRVRHLHRTASPRQMTEYPGERRGQRLFRLGLDPEDPVVAVGMLRDVSGGQTRFAQP